jgi:hypothetical protein
LTASYSCLHSAKPLLTPLPALPALPEVEVAAGAAAAEGALALAAAAEAGDAEAEGAADVTSLLFTANTTGACSASVWKSGNQCVVMRWNEL